NDTTAKASLISNKSTSSIVLPAFATAFGIAIAGVVVNQSGDCSASAYPITLAKGFKPNSSTFSLLINTNAAAPSLIFEEFTAVTVPSLINAGLTAPTLEASNL